MTLTCTGHDPRDCKGPTVLRLRKRELENDRVAVNAELSLLDAVALKAAAADDPDVAVLIDVAQLHPSNVCKLSMQTRSRHSRKSCGRNMGVE